MAPVLAHTPEDMTVTVGTGMTLGALQAQLRRYGQWIPLDPPHADALSVERLLSENRSGPRRFGHGLVRDHLIGLRAVLADGREIHSGGFVVKNVAGYDLHKLLVGAKGSLGIPVEATFKVSPLPEMECWMHRSVSTWKDLRDSLDRVWQGPIQPVVMDVHRLVASRTAPCTLVLTFAGAREDVEMQSAWVAGQGFDRAGEAAYDVTLETLLPGARRGWFSVLPSNLVEALEAVGDSPFVARAGNGQVQCDAAAIKGIPGVNADRVSAPLQALLRRLKLAFDPMEILPPIPA